MFRGFLLTIFLFVFMLPAKPGHASGTVFTLWPLVDYRASEAADYRSVHLLGPIFKYETKGEETEYAVRPFFYRATESGGESLTDVLYPLSSRRNYGDTTSTHIFRLFSTDSGERSEVHHRKFYLFPFLFHGEYQGRGSYSAFFPFAGKLYGWFGRDEIEFFLFPLYGRTQRGTRRVDNILWPFFAIISGEQESGFKFWPIYGQSQKAGSYRKSMCLWPLIFSETTDIESGHPKEVRAFLPFYYSRETSTESYRSVIWPFFNRKIDHEKGYREWNAPWPLVRIVRGENHHGNRFLPFYADETMEVTRKRWYLWPLYRIDEMNTELIESRSDRILFFLYRDLKEYKIETGADKRRILMWPLFGYQRNNGVSHFHVLALLEPFFPENESIERSWAPLWRIYQHKWDAQDNHVVSLFWNLFWSEKRGADIAWELFPLVDYRDASTTGVDLRLLKGLFRYRSSQEGRQLNLFYLPWGISWDRPDPVEA